MTGHGVALLRALVMIAALPVGLLVVRRVQARELAAAVADSGTFGCRATARVSELREAGLLIAAHPRLASAMSTIFGRALWGHLRLSRDGIAFLVPDEGRRVGIADLHVPWQQITVVRLTGADGVAGAPGHVHGRLQLGLSDGRLVNFEAVPVVELTRALKAYDIEPGRPLTSR